MNHTFDTTYKFLILGDTSVGKTSFIEKYSKNTFNHYQKSTIGIDYSIQTVKCDNKIIKLQIWDTAGQERYRSIVKTFYQGAHGILLMYDITNRETYDGIKQWIDEIGEKNDKNIGLVLVGNKSDLEEGRKVTAEEGTKTAESYHIPFFESSAKFNVNIAEAFTMLVKKTYEKVGVVKNENNLVVLEEKKETKKRLCC